MPLDILLLGLVIVVVVVLAIACSIGFPPEPGSLKAREQEIQAKVLVSDEITRADIEVLLKVESPVLQDAVELYRAQKVEMSHRIIG